MRKTILFFISILIIFIILSTTIFVWSYFELQENKRLDAESVILKENRIIKFGQKAKVSDFIENLNKLGAEISYTS